MTNLTGKKVLMVVAPKDFRDEEFLAPKNVLTAAGVQVVVASKGVTEARGILGAVTKIDLDLNQAKANHYDAVVFVGGPGAAVYFNDSKALTLAKQALEQNKVIGAICIAPSILANAGVLKDIKATTFSSEADNLKAKGAILSIEAVVQDGKIITASGPQAAKAFGETITAVLKAS